MVTGGSVAVDTIVVTGGTVSVDTVVVTGGTVAVDTVVVTGGTVAVDTVVVTGGTVAVGTYTQHCITLTYAHYNKCNNNMQYCLGACFHTSLGAVQNERSA